MSAFFVLAGAVLLVTLLWLLLPLQRRDPGVFADEQDTLNLALYQTRRAELAADQQAGLLDPEQHTCAQAELEQEFAQYLHLSPQTYSRRGNWLAGLLLLLLPALAITLYGKLGNLDALVPGVTASAPSAAQPPTATQASTSAAAIPDAQAMQPLLTKLAQRLLSQPEDGKGWMMLGRSYMALERFAEANLAFARARQVLGDDPELLFHYAESLGSLQDGKLDGLAAELILRAVALQPDNAQGVFLAGLATYQMGRLPEALSYWQQLAQLVKDDPQASQLAAQYVAQVQVALAAAPALSAVTSGSTPIIAPANLPEPGTVVIVPVPVAVEPTQTPAPAAQALPGAVPPLTQLTVQVSLAPELQARAPADTTVFVFARAAEGPRMPLAIQRLRVADLPATVTLDDSMAMSPQFKLSQFSPLIVGARVSFSGDAIAQSGDLEALSTPLAGAQAVPVALVIQRILP